jgi:hypothetical protein
MALVPPPATAIMLKKKGIYGHPDEGILHASGAHKKPSEHNTL